MTLYYYDSDTDTTVPVSVEKSRIEDGQELEFIYDETVRKAWDAKNEEWYFSVVDVCQVLTESTDGRKYWNKLKQRLKEEGNQTVTNCHQLKLLSADGKMRKTDCATTELSRNVNPQGYDETEIVTVSGGNVAANARKELEGLLGRSIISSLNATAPIQLDDTKK